MKLIVACVLTGDKKYTLHDVFRLKAGVQKHLPIQHDFVVLTDNARKAKYQPNLQTVEIPSYLHGWWGKMALFERQWRAGKRVIYFDLDTVIVGDLSPLVQWDGEFGICESFTRRSGVLSWPCKYGSCVMSLSPDLDARMWDIFALNPHALMKEAGRYGDQWIIEKFKPDATLLQDVLPSNFFLGYRDLCKYVDGPPANCGCVIYAGGRTPRVFGPKWCKELWK